MRFRQISLPRDEACPVCGDAPTIHELVAYDQVCEPASEDTIAVDELRRWRDDGRAHALIDVREEFEYALSRIDGADLIPLGRLGLELARLPKDCPVIVHCETGARSATAVAMLRTHGFDARNLTGGIRAWNRVERDKR
jgi:rhodanese-related sulfurtransferase